MRQLPAFSLLLFLASTVLAAELRGQEAKPPAEPTDAWVRFIRATMDKAEDARHQRIKVGASVGWRHLVYPAGGYNREASIRPGTDTVHLEEIDRGEVVVSAVLAAYPWKRPREEDGCCATPLLWRVGFIANLDLATIGEATAINFNRSIEGGLGVGVRISDNFSLGTTIERVFSRAPRSFVENGKPLPRTAGTEAKLSTSDDAYFRSDNLTALSMKFIYYIR